MWTISTTVVHLLVHLLVHRVSYLNTSMFKLLRAGSTDFLCFSVYGLRCKKSNSSVIFYKVHIQPLQANKKRKLDSWATPSVADKLGQYIYSGMIHSYSTIELDYIYFSFNVTFFFFFKFILWIPFSSYKLILTKFIWFTCNEVYRFNNVLYNMRSNC